MTFFEADFDKETMTKEKMFKLIRDWECEAGEGFVDYWADSDLNIPNFMFWCRGKGYLTRENFNKWTEAFINKSDYNATAATSIIGGYELDYAICGTNGDMSEDEIMKQEEKSLEVLAEFIADSYTYIDRVKKFVLDYFEN